MICSECNSKFKLTDRIKSMIKRNGIIKCNNCKSKFIEKKSLGILSTSLVMGLIVLLSSTINLFINGFFKNESIVNYTFIFTLLILVPIVMYLSQYWTSYEKVN